MSIHPETEELTKVAIDYGAKAFNDVLEQLRADGFTRSDQCAYIAAMAGVHMVQLHLLRVKENGSREVALRHRQLIAEMIEAAKAWL